jgi:hypothetical protein
LETLRMKYQVVFRERSDRAGQPADNPPSFLDAQLDEETVQDAVFIGRNPSDAQHSSDVLEEDDDFLSLGTEVWQYDIADGKEEDFKNALRNSAMVIEFERLESGNELGIS